MLILRCEYYLVASGENSCIKDIFHGDEIFILNAANILYLVLIVQNDGKSTFQTGVTLPN